MTKQNIISFYESDAHTNQVREILKQAKRIIDLQASLQNCAVVLDIDETSLNHYKALKDVGFPQEENHSIWDELISKIDVEPIKPTLDFYLYCINKGIKVFFISARFATYLDTTKQALQNAGYIGFEGVFVLPEDISLYSSESFKNFKAERRSYIESLGYKVLISIGDQSSDLTGGYTLNTFQLPNYMYGENSVF
ncbi:MULTISPECIES: HAD family acid phosphatase [unclassified Francisella]|uniref:HAD family acid phosphatase n=1 Tax=unclassified Francisella TaxID=2610885 RepID=UPI002E3174EB|nr:MULTISPECIES: HAD family acid phosphatase [unclassified Francisella]MED7818795.1 HAD family acid phosphatase [Francisella sp. 19S2-4]MED7829631.1 HAD family acid phosphatase [Francisella sp. 19S2-10]